MCECVYNRQRVMGKRQEGVSVHASACVCLYHILFVLLCVCMREYKSEITNQFVSVFVILNL
jgi:hypothetical protein